MYEGDTPNAERRAAALALDRDLLRELLGQEELRELIDPEALDEVEAQLQHRTEAGRASDRDALQQVLRTLGDLTADEAAARVEEGYSAASMLEKLVTERRAAKVRIDGEERYIAAEDAGLYRDALGVPPPGGLPESFLEEHDDPMRALVRRYAAHPRPLPDRAARRALRGRPDRRRCASWSRPGRWSAASCCPAAPSASGATPTSCAASAGPASPTCARRSSRPTAASSPASCRAGRTSTPTGAAGAGTRPPARGAGPAPGGRADARRSGSGTCCRGASAPTARPGSTSSAPAARSSGSAPARSAAATAGSLSTSARTSASPARRPPTPSSSRREGEVHDAIRERLGAGPCFWLDLLADLDARAEELHTALWDLAWSRRGHQRRLRAAAGAAAARRRRLASARGRRFSRRRPAAAGSRAGPLVADRSRCSRTPRRPGRGCAPRPS